MPKEANNPFLHGDKYSRYFGGSKGENPLDAYISGYHYVFFEVGDEIEKAIYAQIVENSINGHEAPFDKNVFDILNIHNTNFTPASRALNKVTTTAMGGRKFSQASSMEIGDTITVNYNEYSGLPIYKIHKYWLSAIRNTEYGISNLTGNADEISFSHKEDFSANIYYATVRPDGKTIETAHLYTGVWPTKIPTDVFASELGADEKIDMSIDYSFDMLYDNNESVIKKIQTLIGESLSSGLEANKARIKV